jgi:histidinol-phosphatase (PHP family)
MPFSHHSHSGQFCPGHASDTLEQVIQTAISKQLRVFGLTEHMPRHDVDQYPEERDTGSNLEWHFNNEAAYVREALRLRQKYQGQIEMPLGFECDWIRRESQELIERSIKAHPFDYFVGSVHHVHTIPIDYDAQMYTDAKQKAGGTDERLFEDYYDAQLEMLKAVRPPVIGHFDLIRLKSANPNGSFRGMPGAWERIIRNLDFVASYGGILEINTAALRKGMSEPYPKQEICQVSVPFHSHPDTS